MEKRLPLALFLSFLLFFGWTFLFGPPPAKRAESTNAAPVEVDELAPQRVEPERELPPADVAADAEELLTLTLDRGKGGGNGKTRGGAAGHYYARFTNKGALLLELRDGDWFVHDMVLGTDETDPHDNPANWTPLLLPVETGAGTTGSLAWTTNESSRHLTHVPLDEALWVAEKIVADGKERGVVFRYAPGTGVVFEKRVEVVPGTHRLRVRLTIENQSRDASGERQFLFTPAACVPPELDDQFYIEPQVAAAGPYRVGSEQQSMKLDTEAKKLKADELFGPLDVAGPLAFAGGFNKYFAVLMRGADDDATASMVSASYRRVADAKWADEQSKPVPESLRYVAAEVDLKLFVPPEGETRSWTYELYAGPKRPDLFVADSAAHELILDHDLASVPCTGFIIPVIGKFLIQVLSLLERLVGNWGVAIILLTFCIRAILFPLNRRSQTSMARYQKKMKRVQPKIDELKKKYEKNPQKLRQEQARIMQEEKAFPPLGGCLPIFLQLPVFFGLFSALRTSFDLRQASFYGWMDDLSRPDRMFRIDWNVPFLGTIEYFNLLPPLMVVLWILQQRTMPKPADEQQARMQRMMMFMPIVMGVFLYNYAAGLSLYMITQSGLGIFEQAFIKKRWPVKDDEVVKEKPGCGPFSGIMQNLAEKQRAQMKRMQAVQAQKKKGGGGKKGGRRKR